MLYGGEIYQKAQGLIGYFAYIKILVRESVGYEEERRGGGDLVGGLLFIFCL